MKNIIIILILLTTPVFSQLKVDTNPSIIGMTLGEKYSQWKDYLTFKNSTNKTKIYNYTNASDFDVFGYPIDYIEMIFDNNEILIGFNIKTKEFKESGWRDTEFTNVKNNLEYLFGEADGYISPPNNNGDIYWHWMGENNVLASMYNFQGSFKGSYIIITLMKKEILMYNMDNNKLPGSK